MIQQLILDTLATTKGLDQRKLSHIAGVSESSFSRYLHGLENITLHSTLKIVKYLYLDQEKEIMAEYVLTQKSRNARFALEYCDINNLSDHVIQLTESLSKSDNPVDKEWATLYEMLIRLKEKTISLDKLTEKIELFNPKEIEMLIMKQLLKAYIANAQNNNSTLHFHVSETEKLLDNIKSDFIKSSYNIRLGIIMGHVSLYLNNMEQTRYYNSLVINQDLYENLKGLAYNNLGYAYIFEDYKKSKHYLDKAIDIYSKYNQQEKINIAKINLTFLNSFWKKNETFSLELNSDNNIANYIYYLIQKGNLSLAKEYIDKIDITSFSDLDKGFIYFFQGLINERKKDFYYSIKWFQRSRDFFNIQLPINKLLEMGEDEEILSVWKD